MNAMSIFVLVLKYGSPWVLVFPMIWIIIRMGDVRKSIEDMKNELVWKDVFDEWKKKIEEDIKELKEKIK